MAFIEAELRSCSMAFRKRVPRKASATHKVYNTFMKKIGQKKSE